jgi:hypothetical protein
MREDPGVQLSPTHEDAVRRLDRLAGRLRVAGPRLAAREGAEARQTLAAIRSGLQGLADLAADADGEPRRVVPGLSAHALADQALVLGHDVLGHDVLGPDGGRDRTDIFRARAVEAFEQILRLL